MVLVMCGSMGCGPVQKIAAETLAQMPDNSVMVAVCGRNEKLREEMAQIADPRLRVLGFIENFPEYLDAADLIISKGQANYEGLSGCGRNIFYIFMCKCELFINRFKLPRFSGVLTREGKF